MEIHATSRFKPGDTIYAEVFGAPEKFPPLTVSHVEAVCGEGSCDIVYDVFDSKYRTRYRIPEVHAAGTPEEAAQRSGED